MTIGIAEIIALAILIATIVVPTIIHLVSRKKPKIRISLYRARKKVFSGNVTVDIINKGGSTGYVKAAYYSYIIPGITENKAYLKFPNGSCLSTLSSFPIDCDNKLTFVFKYVTSKYSVVIPITFTVLLATGKEITKKINYCTTPLWASISVQYFGRTSSDVLVKSLAGGVGFGFGQDGTLGRIDILGKNVKLVGHADTLGILYTKLEQNSLVPQLDNDSFSQRLIRL